MNCKILIKNKVSQAVVMEYVIDLLSPAATVADYFDEAWECAIDELLVNPHCRKDYAFYLVDQLIH